MTARTTSLPSALSGIADKEGVMPLKIGELAKRSGCQVVTIRYYEKEGLLPPPERTDSNYRLYGDATWKDCTSSAAAVFTA